MKYYLYELGENLNNLLSTESVSPCSFYKIRGFGYKYLEKRSVIHLDNVIILFSKPVIVRARDEYYDTKHFPVVIEISDDFINDSDSLIDITDKCKGILEDIKVFAYPKTIFFSALTDKFFFRNNNEFSWAKNTADKSIETKLYGFYERCGAFIKSFETLNHITEINSESFSIDCFKLNIYDPQTEALKDKYFDRLKGAVYGYLFGLAASLTKTEQQSWKNYKELVNYASLSINKKQLSENVKLYAEKLKTSFSQELLPYLERYMIALKNFVTALSKQENQEILSRSQEKFDVEKVTLDEYFRKYIYSNQINRRAFGIGNIPKVDKDRVTFPYDQKDYSAYIRKLVNDVINLILINNENITAEGSEDKVNLIKRISYDCLIPLYSKEAWNKIKQIAKNNPGISEFRLSDDLTINNLLQNVLNSMPFDYSRLENKPDLLSLCSSVSYMTKDLLSFVGHLYALNISNLSVPFAIWGAFYGYSAFDKRYSELFYSSENFEELKKIYSLLLSRGKISAEYQYNEAIYFQEDAIRHDIANQIVNSMETGVSKLNEYYLIKQAKMLNNCKDELSSLKKQYEDLKWKLSLEQSRSKEQENKKQILEQENHNLKDSIEILKKEIEKQKKDSINLKIPSNISSDKQKESISACELWSDFVKKVTNKDNPNSPSLFEKYFGTLKLQVINKTKEKSKNMPVKKKKELCSGIQKLMREEYPQHFEIKMKEIYPIGEKNIKLIEEYIYNLIKDANNYTNNKYDKLLTEFCGSSILGC